MTSRHEMVSLVHGFCRSLDKLALLALLVLTGLAGSGCHGKSTSTSEPDPAAALTRSFPAQATRVLRGSESFAATATGFALPIQGDPATAVAKRGGLSAALPKRGDEAIRFHTLGGFEFRVHEGGAEGAGRLTEGAVAYDRRGGTSFWSATEEGYEEWLMLGPGVATGRAPVATWDVEGATVREGAGAVEILGSDGGVKVRVRAPIAFAQDGASVPVRLSARGSHIELWADSAGEPVLVDPVWSTAAPVSGARRDHAAVVLSSGEVLVMGGHNGSAYVGTTQLYDPALGTWSTKGPMDIARGYHAAVLLNDGKVLVVGGQGNSTPSVLSSAELYNPSTGTWSTTGTMASRRYRHSAVLLSDGTVLVTGGFDGSTYLSTAERYGLGIWLPAGNMNNARWAHTSTLLASNEVLIVGGRNTNGYLAEAERYNLTTGWTGAGTMPAQRGYHTATLLNDGKVLVTGGYNLTDGYLASATVYNSGSWSTTTASMIGARAYHTAVQLSNGKVLVTGGSVGGSNYLNTTQLYDPTGNTWTSGGTMLVHRTYHTASLLSSGKVLIVGGFGGGGPFYGPLSGAELFDPLADNWVTGALSLGGNRWLHTATALQNGTVWVAGGTNGTDLATTQLFNPSTGLWTSKASMSTARVEHTATLLQDGDVLVAGGSAGGVSVASAQVYEPATNHWVSSVGALNQPRHGHTATRLQDGRVLVTGGYSAGSPVASVEIYDPAQKTWAPTGSMSTSRYGHAATLLADGRVLVAGGYTSAGINVGISSAEIYSPVTGSWLPTGVLNTARYYHTATRLPNGNVLVAGGSSSGAALASAEVFDVGGGSWTLVPTSMSTPRSRHTATSSSNGWVIVAGGQGTSTSSSVQIYDPVSAAWLTAAPMNAARHSHTATLLQSGKLLVAGGYNLSSWEIYTSVDDGDLCTSETWDPTLKQVTRAPVVCNTPPDACHTATGATCNPAVGCVYQAVSNGTSCDDGSACTQTDSCEFGVCVGANPVVCTALDECHDAGTCDTATGLCSTPGKPDGASCGAGQVCVNAVCNAGCVILGVFYAPGAGKPANACEVCAPAMSTSGWSDVTDGTGCDDGSACTAPDVCQAGVCVGTNLPAETSCSNGDPCDGFEKCDGAGVCQAGVALAEDVVCNDDPCWPKRCQAGQCAGNALSGIPCDDGTPCKADATCQVGVCVADPQTNGASCSDGNLCNGAETCQDGICAPGTPLIVADSDPCTTQTCDPATGTVSTTMCASIDPTLPTDIADANPGLISGAIDASRVAVLLGLVTQSDGSTPIPDVGISIVGAPELGAVATELDGHFVMAVNGGGTVRVRYEKAGYLPVERMVETRWKDYSWLPNVVMTPLDTHVKNVELDSPTLQVMRGSLVQDEDGQRQATVLIPSDTIAIVVRTVDGTTTSTQLTSGTLALRATEYTVGPNGREAMPGPLPPSTAYTYAVELSADEALDADTIQFVDAQDPLLPRKLQFYVENFINFPVGASAPMGYYDRQKGVWVPSENGVVVQILDDPANNSVKLATKLVNGTPTEPDPAEADALGITPDELEQLHDLYKPGQTLWRVPITHFTPCDINWPYGLPSGACSSDDEDCQPPSPIASAPKPSDGCEGTGSIIECQGQVLRESMPVAGTPHGLHYASDRAPGRREAYRLTIPVVGTVPLAEKLRHITLTIQVAGQKHTEKFVCPCDGLPPYVFEWDGNDVFGRRMQGAQPARYDLRYTYNAEYMGASGGASFGGGGAIVLGFAYQINRNLNTVSGVRTWQGTLGTWDERGAGLGGWSLDAHHVYDPQGQVLYRGDGSRRAAADTAPTIFSVAGGGPLDYQNTQYEGNPNTVYIHTAGGVAAAPDGSVYFVDSANSGDSFSRRIGIVRPNGLVETLMMLPTATGPIVRAPDGSLFVVTATEIGTRHRIQKIDDTGIHTVAGNGCVCGTGGTPNCDPGQTPTPCDYEGDALSASLQGTSQLVRALSLGPDGSLYVADNARVRRISPDGRIHNFAGTGQCVTQPNDPNAEPPPALDVNLGSVFGLFAAPNGNVYISSSCSNVPTAIRVVTPDGKISTIAGGLVSGPTEDGLPALETRLSAAGALTVTRDGLVIFDDAGRVRMVDPQGVIVTLSQSSSACPTGFCGNGWAAALTGVGVVRSLATSPDGSLLIGASNRVYRIVSPLPRYGLGNIRVPSEDGSEVYEFDHTGRHLATRHALTDAIKIQFGYDDGKLVSVTDASTQSFATTIDYTNANQPKIIGPFGDETRLSLDSNNNLQSLTRNGGTASLPVDEVYQLTASADGLLTWFRDPVGNEHNFHYDSSTGRLNEDDDPGDPDPEEQLFSVDSTTGVGNVTDFTVTHTRRQQSGTYQKSFSILTDKKGIQERENTFPGVSTHAKHNIGKDGIQTMELPDGTTVSMVPNTDPRFYMLAPTYKTTTTVPGNAQGAPALSQTVDVRRLFDTAGVFHQTTTLNDTKTTDVAVLADNQTVVYTTPGGRTWRMTLDAYGRVTGGDMTTLGLGTASAGYGLAYGQLGTTSRTADGTTRSVARAYYPAGTGIGISGRPASVTDPLMRSVSFGTYDRAGRLLNQVLPGSRPIGFHYDVNGELVQLDPPPITPQHGASTALQAEHRFTPNGLGFLAQYSVNEQTTPATQLASTGYAYTPDRLLKMVSRPEGDAIAFSNSNGRLDRVDLPAISVPSLGTILPSESVVLHYDSATGHLHDVAGSDETVTFGYNGRLMTDVTWTGLVNGALSLAYDADFAVTSESAAGVPLHIGRDADGVPTCVGFLPIASPVTDCTGVLGGMLSVAYRTTVVGAVAYPTFQPAGATLVGTSIADTYLYNGFGEVRDYVAEGPGAVTYYDEHYERDALGRIYARSQTIQGTGHDYVYTYDVAGRLTDVETDATSTTHYDYDANGNRLRRLVDGVVVEQGVYDVEDRQESYGGRSFVYTASGQLQSATDGAGTTYYVYDALGNLRHVRLPGGTRIDYVVDGLGRRVGKKVNDALVKGWLYASQLRIAAEIDYDTQGQIASVKRFAYGVKSNVPDMMIVGGVRYRIFSDHLGSPRLLVHQDGTVVGRWDYDEFGRRTAGTGNTVELPFGFAGGLYDGDTGLVRFGARDYDAVTGRWTAKDPVRFGGGDSNLYAYAGADPLNYVDLTGTDRFAAARRVFNGGIELLRNLTRSQALEHVAKGRDVAADSGKAAAELAQDASRAAGGAGKAKWDNAHNKGELGHYHVLGKNNRKMGGHIYNAYDLFADFAEMFAPPVIPGTFDWNAAQHGGVCVPET